MREIETLIVGGGISGLATAWQLAAQGQSAELWEADERLGGKIQTHQNKGYTTEQAASMVLNFRPEVSDFLRNSGLDNHKLVRSPASKRYLIHQGALQEMPMKLGGMLRSPLWSLRGKLRLALEPFVLAGAAENESVADFIRRRLGSEMLDKALSAYISGTLASDPAQADSLSVLPHLNALERRYGSLTAGVFARRILNRKRASNTEGFSFRGGMSTLVDELARQLGGSVHKGHRIEHIERHGTGWLVTAQTSESEISCRCKNLILCTPAPATAELIKNVNPDLGNLLGDIDYAAVSVVHLAYAREQIKHPALGTGFLTPWQEKLSLNGSMWMHSLFSGRAPEGQLLMSNYMGGARRPDIAAWSDQQRLGVAQQELSRLLGIRGEVLWQRVDHHPQALPLYHGHYSLRQQAIYDALTLTPGLHLQANYLGGVSIRDRIVCAQRLATRLLKQHRPDTASSSYPPETALIESL